MPDMAGGGITHFTADGTQVYTLREAEAITGVQHTTLRQRLHRANVQPMGKISPQESVYTAEQLGMVPAAAPRDGQDKR